MIHCTIFRNVGNNETTSRVLRVFLCQRFVFSYRWGQFSSVSVRALYLFQKFGFAFLGTTKSCLASL